MHHSIFYRFLEHEEGLTTDVMTDIKKQMRDNLNDVKNIAELWARGNY